MKTLTSENRQLIVEKFHEHLDINYDQFCKRHDIIPSTNTLITFLIDQGLIPAVSIKRYTVRQEFEEFVQKKQQKKTQIVNALSDKFNIPERTVWSILKKKEG